MRIELDRQAFVDEKSSSLFSGSTLSSRRRVVNDHRLSYRRMGFYFQADKGNDEGAKKVKMVVVSGSQSNPLHPPLSCPHFKYMQRRRDLHQRDNDHSSNTSQGDLASLKGNTSAVGALGSRSDGRTSAGNDCRLESSRADGGTDEVMAG